MFNNNNNAVNKQIFKSQVKRGTTVILFRNDFGNYHIAIWDGENIDLYKEEESLPWNFRKTPSYGRDIKNPFLIEKFNSICSLAGTVENHIAIK